MTGADSGAGGGTLAAEYELFLNWTGLLREWYDRGGPRSADKRDEFLGELAPLLARAIAALGPGNPYSEALADPPPVPAPAVGGYRAVQAWLRATTAAVYGGPTGDAGRDRATYPFLKAAADPNALGRVKDYVVWRVLGVGGMGVVFEASQVGSRHTPDRVALKAVLPTTAFPDTRARFDRELDVLTRLQGSPNVVQLKASGRTRAVRFFVMEHVFGPSLHDLLDLFAGRPVPVPLVVELLRQAATGLAAAHGLHPPVVHRDLTPRNVFLERVLGGRDAPLVWRVRVGDFGLATQAGAVPITAAGVAMGTERYWAPEQRLGGVADDRTDVYALGVIALEMLTGRVPQEFGTFANCREALLGAGASRRLTGLVLGMLTPVQGSRTAAGVVAEQLAAIRDRMARRPAPASPMDGHRPAPPASEPTDRPVAPAGGPRVVPVAPAGPGDTRREEAAAEAVRRIVAAEVSGQWWLDLGDLGLVSVPREVERLQGQLRALALGAMRVEVNGGTPEWYMSDQTHLLSGLGSLETLTELTTLNLCGCGAVADLGPLKGLNKLTTLDLRGCAAVADLGPLETLTKLTTVDLSFCAAVEKLGPLETLTELTTLNLWDCGAVADLGPLETLTNLTTLDLSFCAAVEKLGPLKKLTKLTTLNLGGCGAVADLGPLETLTELTTLNLWDCGAVADLGPLETLTNLTTLDLSFCAAVEKLGPLKKLTKLTTLNLRGCAAVADLGPLKKLTKLTTLNLGGCAAVADLGPLETLTKLTTLNLRGCAAVEKLGPLETLTKLTTLNLGGCGAVADLGPLKGLNKLTTLDLCGCGAVADLGPLKGLNKLTTLDLRGCAAVEKLGPLKKLTKLTTLNLRGCAAVADLGPLETLTELTTLDLSGCQVPRFAPVRNLLTTLNTLLVAGSRFTDLHPAVCGNSPTENSLESVRRYFAALGPDPQPDAEVKVFVLGNGRAGKTKLVGRLRGKAFDDIPEGSTHGVRLHSIPLADPDLPHPVRLNVWDFGGQDVYHGTHALFLRGPAVYLVLYARHLENDDESADGGVPVRNRRLAYWLDYLLQEAGEGRAEDRRVASPVLIVQGHCDAHADEDPRPPAGPDPARFPNLRFLHVGTRGRGRGLDRLREQLREALTQLLARHPQPPLPAAWAAVRQAVRRTQATNKKRLMTQLEFRALCDARGCGPDAEVLRDALHRLGVVFHCPGVFGGRVVVDQAWALGKVYAVFTRDEAFQRDLRDKGGRFRRADLERHVWRGEPPADQRAYLGMMEQCDVCFRTDEYPAGDYDGRYVAPDLLPAWDDGPAREFGGWAGRADAGVTATYGLLHDGIARGFLAKIGVAAGGRADYWRYGCRFRDAATGSEVLVRTAGNAVRMEARDGAAASLLRTLVDVLLTVPSGRPPRVEWDGAAGPGPPAAGPAGGPPEDRLRPERRPRVFVSRAPGESGDAAAALAAALGPSAHAASRDPAEKRPGASVARFLRGAGGGDAVVLLVGEQYLRSEACMAELVEAYLWASGGEPQPRVVPVLLAGASVLDRAGRAGWALHWRRQVEVLEGYARGGLLADGDLAAYRSVAAWAGRVPDALQFVADELGPVPLDRATAGDWTVVREALGREQP